MRHHIIRCGAVTHIDHLIEVSPGAHYGFFGKIQVAVLLRKHHIGILMQLFQCDRAFRRQWMSFSHKDMGANFHQLVKFQILAGKNTLDIVLGHIRHEDNAHIADLLRHLVDHAGHLHFL